MDMRFDSERGRHAGIETWVGSIDTPKRGSLCGRGLEKAFTDSGRFCVSKHKTKNLNQVQQNGEKTKQGMGVGTLILLCYSRPP